MMMSLLLFSGGTALTSPYCSGLTRFGQRNRRKKQTPAAFFPYPGNFSLVVASMSLKSWRKDWESFFPFFTHASRMPFKTFVAASLFLALISADGSLISVIC